VPFFLRGAVYCRAEDIISRHTTIDVVRSTARGPALTRDSQELVGLLPSRRSHRSLYSYSNAAESGRFSVYAVYILIGIRCTDIVVVVASFTGSYVYSNIYTTLRHSKPERPPLRTRKRNKAGAGVPGMQ